MNHTNTTKIPIQHKKIIPNKVAPISSQSTSDLNKGVTIMPIQHKKTIPIKVAPISSQFTSELLNKGVAVIPLFDQKELSHWNNAFISELSTFPEYINSSTSNIFVYGAFGGLGNPSSFHNPTVRSLRIRIMQEARKILAPIATQHQTTNIEQLFDRMCIRRKGTKTTPENWHRDISPDSKPGDIIFGGWVNLDLQQSQYFSCVPGTQIDHNNQTTGFSVLTTQQISEFSNKKQIIEIPPGHWIIFYQDIVHEIISRKVMIDSYRLYMGFRLTNSKTPLYDHTKIINDQGIPILPGGMKPSMYSQLNLAFHQKQLVDWSLSIKPVCHEIINKKSGQKLSVVQKHMNSLKEFKLPLYTPYTQNEINILNPHPI